MIAGPVTVLTTPLIVVFLKDDGDQCVANWIERPRMMDRSSSDWESEPSQFFPVLLPLDLPLEDLPPCHLLLVSTWRLRVLEDV